MEMKPDHEGATPTDLLGRMLEFFEALRRAGLTVTPGRMIDALRSVQLVGIVNRDKFRLALRANLVTSRDEEAVFDRVFEAFWARAAFEVQKSELKLEPREDERNRELAEGPRDLRGSRLQYSPDEATGTKDLAGQWPGGSKDLDRAIRELADRLATRPSRRFRMARRGRRIDLRRSLRKNMRYGMDFVELARLRPKLRKTRIVMLCDVSGSMDTYTPFLLELMLGVQKTLKNSRTVVFSTRATEITRELRRQSVRETLRAVADQARHWSGGTDIGLALRQLNRRVMQEGSPGATVGVIVSDGYDQGDPTMVRREMEALRRRTRSIVWVNPLLGTEGYAPLAKGMRAALPYVDHFLPAHDVPSLRALCRTLAQA
jgi:uncharacterized protein with von Willebrand factor type A (vWA) domain